MNIVTLYKYFKMYFIYSALFTIYFITLNLNANELINNSTPLKQYNEVITVNSVNLSAKQFFLAYLSKSSNERKNAELYLLGVMDMTEGKSWCDYETFKTITLREQIYTSFKKLNEKQLSKRAAIVIEQQLKNRYPCRSIK